VRHKQSSLAFDDEVRDLDLASDFEPELTVIVNEHYSKSLHKAMASNHDVMQVRGSITVSF
jgi:hypothetical protein